ncbi:MAG: hypothetical protein HXS43_01370 [Theionarchaea archaeon]|nr:hypothetical protein [Theionarchaea archaeon]
MCTPTRRFKVHVTAYLVGELLKKSPSGTGDSGFKVPSNVLSRLSYCGTNPNN